MKVTVSPIQEADYDAAAEAIASGPVFQRHGTTPASALEVLKDSNSETVVARLEGDVVGVAIFWTDGRSPVPAYLRILAVREGFRGRGVGTALLRYVEARAFAVGPNLFLCCESTNVDARRLYEREGYREVGTLTDLFAPGSHEILLRKTLGPMRGYVPPSSSLAIE